jgi:hypothetical protein
MLIRIASKGGGVSNQDGAGVGPINSLALDGSLTLTNTGLTLNSGSATSIINNLNLIGPKITGGTTLTVNGKAEFKGVLTLSDGGVQGQGGAATITGTVKAVKGQNAHPFLTTQTVDNKGSINVAEDGVQFTLGGQAPSPTRPARPSACKATVSISSRALSLTWAALPRARGAAIALSRVEPSPTAEESRRRRER